MEENISFALDLFRNKFGNSEKNSDFHAKEGFKASIRSSGSLIEISEPLTHEQIEEIISTLFILKWGKELGMEKYTEFKDSGTEIDFAVNISDTVRARVNCYKSMGIMGCALRQIPSTMPKLENIGFDEIHKHVIQNLASKKEGLILVTGQTGSGKSTTLASIVNYINEHSKKHIITIEDPVEFRHKNKSSIITHREVGEGADTKTFFSGLKGALRQDPDIILVGEIRDAETCLAAMQAAQTGHIVLGTLHTNSAPETITRIIDMFPAEKVKTVLTSISQSLLAVISQKLVPNKNGGRTLAYELMINSEPIKQILNSGEGSNFAKQIESKMIALRNEGMETLVYRLSTLVQNNIIDEEVALEFIPAGDDNLNKFNLYLGREVFI